MVGLIDKLKSQIEIWKVEKYTKRRTFLPEYDSRDTEYYRQHYHDGVYYNSDQTPPPPQARTPTSTQYRSSLGKRMSVMIKKKSSSNSLPHPRCSETYNANYER
ncbi:uncharacterized protein BX664DRAFT_324289 [Halteromyces radiatus]|uniref:uncharacterized protein n=1 Tax=Halteromyces radiatus TaxID=101107 RepID=UPI00222010D8|nr:uncharacterized protein BX664DRAFT_324289 [Halteromyces radiatus]KAI8096570.1 hypothetical protein BX664DRAFT_324289 [Halteromyces radiatus]